MENMHADVRMSRDKWTMSHACVTRNRGRALSNSSYLLGEYLFEVGRFIELIRFVQLLFNRMK